MDVVIADAELRQAAEDIETALKSLALICDRAAPLLEQVYSSGALSSDNMRQKYAVDMSLCAQQARMSIDGLQGIVGGKASDFLTTVDKIDRFIY